MFGSLTEENSLLAREWSMEYRIQEERVNMSWSLGPFSTKEITTKYSTRVASE